MIDRLVVLGAAGDLATRHLLAALSHLARAGGLPADFRILGVDRAALTTDTYRERARGALTAQAPTVGSLDRADLVRRLDYRQADLSQQPDLGSDLGAEPVIAYLALPPSAYT
ncbi:MAG: glucose-6-phosphate dehydrogenase, partial [Actinomycetota bacterium]|nr:glucose-6-phosphate dehydrogenase [Actinomycetota bacterium]